MKKFKFKNYIGKLVAFTVVFIFSFVIISVPCLASTQTLSFNLWDKYRNAIKIGMEYSYSDTGLNYQYEYAYTNDNIISFNDNVTTITNRYLISPSSSFPVNSNSNGSYINKITISTPTDVLEPVFFVSEPYLNKPITFSFQLELTAVNCTFWKSHGNNGPTMVLYLGSKNSYTQIVGKTSNSVWRLDSTTLYYRFDCTFTFTKTNFICGFWFQIADPSEIGIYLNGIPDYPQFSATYTLSPLVFSDDITSEDVEKSVESALNSYFGNDYDGLDDSSLNAYFDKENAIFNGLDELNNRFSLPDILGLFNSNLDFKYALMYFSNILQSSLKLPFVNILIILSTSLGAIGFLFGLAQVVSKISNSFSNSGERKNSGGRKK